MAAKLRVTQTKSAISHIGRNRATIRALGLGRIGSTVVVPDNDATRGMVRQVRFLVSVEGIEEAPARGHARSATKASAEDNAPAAEQGSAGEETSS